MHVIDDQWICQDCLFFIANGDLPSATGGSEEADARVIAGCEREAAAGGHWALDSAEDGSDTLDFSRSDCDCCGSSLGGSRHRAAVLYSNAPAEATASAT